MASSLLPGPHACMAILALNTLTQLDVRQPFRQRFTMRTLEAMLGRLECACPCPWRRCFAAPLPPLLRGILGLSLSLLGVLGKMCRPNHHKCTLVGLLAVMGRLAFLSLQGFIGLMSTMGLLGLLGLMRIMGLLGVLDPLCLMELWGLLMSLIGRWCRMGLQIVLKLLGLMKLIGMLGLSLSGINMAPGALTLVRPNVVCQFSGTCVAFSSIGGQCRNALFDGAQALRATLLWGRKGPNHCRDPNHHESGRCQAMHPVCLVTEWPAPRWPTCW